MVIMETIQSWVFLLTLLAAAALGAKLLGDAMLRMEDLPEAAPSEPAHPESPINTEFVQLLKSEASDEPYDQYADVRR